jgi:hypothetical protein
MSNALFTVYTVQHSSHDYAQLTGNILLLLMVLQPLVGFGLLQATLIYTFKHTILPGLLLPYVGVLQN